MRRPRSVRTSWLCALLLSLALVSCWKVDADLALSTHALNFGTTQESATVTVTNDSKDNALTSGVTPLEYQFKSDRPWITVMPASGHCGEEESETHTVSLDRASLPLGDNLATITVTSNGGKETISVRATRTLNNCNRELTALSLSSPADHATGVPVDTVLSWTGGESQCDGQQSTYEVYFGAVSPPPYREDTPLQSWSAGALEAGTPYYWRIVAKDDAGHTSSSSERQFTTAEAPCAAGPGEITLLSPANQAQVEPTQDLLWSGGESQCEGLAATYDVYFGTRSPPPLDHNNGTSKTWDPGTFASGVAYYWRIVANDANGSRSSEERSFRLMCETVPDAPCGPSPQNGKSKVNENSSLTWQCGESNCGLSITYDVYLGTTSSLGVAQKVGTTTSRSWPLSGVAGNTKYYWKVAARDENGSKTSPVWNFTTRER